MTADTRLEIFSACRQRERNSEDFPGRACCRIEGLFQHDPAGDLSGQIRRQRLRVVVVEIDAEHLVLRIRALEVMPHVGRHEEQPAMLRIVIRVRGLDVTLVHRRSVGTLSRRRPVYLWMVGARPRHGCSDRHEVAPANRTLAGSLFGDDGMNRTAPDGLGLRHEQLRAGAGRLRQRQRPRPVWSELAEPGRHHDAQQRRQLHHRRARQLLRDRTRQRQLAVSALKVMGSDLEFAVFSRSDPTATHRVL